MRRVVFLTVSLIWLQSNAIAVAQLGPAPAINPQTLGQPNGPAQLDSLGTAGALTVLGRTLAARAGDVVNVADYGAKCDGTTDDTAAINSAFAAVRARTNNYVGIGTINYSHIVFPSAKSCLHTRTINATGLVGYTVAVDGGGATLDCRVPGGICVDALGSRWIHWRDLSIIGNATANPTIGLQIGRTNITSLNSSDGMNLDNVFIDGTFSLASFYNFSSETGGFTHSFFWNRSASPTAYAVIQDGYNHFNALSAFVTQSAPLDSGQSFNENLFTNVDIRNFGGGPNLWLGGTTRHKFVASYSATIAAKPAVVFYGEGGSNNTQVSMDMHFETTAMTDVFLVSGSNTTPVLNGFEYRDHSTFAANSVFKADTGITSVILRNADIAIANYAGGSAHLFDNPALWTVTGNYWSPGLTQFNGSTAASWQGRVSTGQQTTQAFYGTGAFSLQFPDGGIAGGNTRGNNAVDLQTSRTVNNQAALGPYSVILGGASNQANQAYAIAGGYANFATATGNVALGMGNGLSGINSAAAGGSSANDHGAQGRRLWANGAFRTSGDAQLVDMIFRGKGSGTTPIRLVADGTTATSTSSLQNCNQLLDGYAQSFNVLLQATDHTTYGKYYSWSLSQGMATRSVGAASFSLTLGTPQILTSGTVTGASVSLTADTTLGCFNLAFTPPSANTTDVWDVVARIEAVEVQ